MQIGFKYSKVRGFGRLYEYSFKHTHMITKEAKQRLKILEFWWQFGLEAAQAAYGAKRYFIRLAEDLSGKRFNRAEPR